MGRSDKHLPTVEQTVGVPSERPVARPMVAGLEKADHGANDLGEPPVFSTPRPGNLHPTVRAGFYAVTACAGLATAAIENEAGKAEGPAGISTVGPGDSARNTPSLTYPGPRSDDAPGAASSDETGPGD